MSRSNGVSMRPATSGRSGSLKSGAQPWCCWSAGDYVLFDGVSHSWQAEEASVVLSVRWPSVPGYAAPARIPNGRDAHE